MKCGRLLVLLVFLVGVAGCSPDGNNDSDFVPTPTSPPFTPVPTSPPTPTLTPRESTAVIRVSGNAPILFSGTITDPSGASRTVEGLVPQEFPVAVESGGTVVGTFTKKTAGRDNLEVAVLYQDDELKKVETNAEFGSVTVVARIP